MRIRFGYPTKRTRRNSGYFQGHTSILSITLYLLIYQRLDWTSPITNARTAFMDLTAIFSLQSMGEDSKYGKINYTIKASILLPRGETTNSMEDTFYVAAVPDPSVPKPHEDDLPKVCYSSFFFAVVSISCTFLFDAICFYGKI